MEVVKFNEYNELNLNQSIQRIEYDIEQVEGDYIIVKNNKLKGLYNKKGELLFEPKYHTIEPFKEGRAVVSLDNQYGIIDGLGQEVVTLIPSKIVSLNNGYYLMGEEGHQNIIDSEGKILLEQDYDQVFIKNIKEPIVVKKDNKVGAIKDNKIVIPLEYPYLSQFKDGVAIFGQVKSNRYQAKIGLESSYNSEPSMSLGVIDQNNNIIIEPIYQSISIINKDRYLVIKDKNNCMIIDSKGNTIKKIKKDSIYQLCDFKNGIAQFNHLGYFGLINEEGEILNQDYYEKIKPFKHNLAAVMRSMLGWGVINKEGKEVLSSYHMHGFTSVTEDGLIEAMQYGSQWGLYDENGQELFPLLNGNRQNYKYKNGILIEKNNNTYKIMDKHLKELVPEFRADNVYVIDSDLVIIDNHLINIKDIKKNYNLEIIYGDKIKHKTFDSEKERLAFETKLSQAVSLLLDECIEEEKTKTKKK